MDYYSALERKKILSPDAMWMNLEDVSLSEIRRSKKTNTT